MDGWMDDSHILLLVRLEN